MWNPYDKLVGGYGPVDGTIDFYGRVGTLAGRDKVLLDMGAGRAEWFEDDTSDFRKSVRYMKSKFGTVIAADVDIAVLENRTAHRAEVMHNGIIPLSNNEVDVIVSDYVLEHVDDVQKFVSEVDRVLKPGGWFCARTPHKYNYVSIASRIIGQKSEHLVLPHAQPNRKEIDVFPKRYKINTLSSIRNAFQIWDDHSFVYRTEPSYYFGSQIIFGVQSLLHRVLPIVVSGNIFVFLRKPEEK